MSSNPFAFRFREAAFALEHTNIPEIAEMLHIASREIERLESAMERLETALEATVGGGQFSPTVCRAMATFWEGLAKRVETETGSPLSDGVRHE